MVIKDLHDNCIMYTVMHNINKENRSLWRFMIVHSITLTYILPIHTYSLLATTVQPQHVVSSCHHVLRKSKCVSLHYQYAWRSFAIKSLGFLYLHFRNFSTLLSNQKMSLNKFYRLPFLLWMRYLLWIGSWCACCTPRMQKCRTMLAMVWSR